MSFRLLFKFRKEAILDFLGDLQNTIRVQICTYYHLKDLLLLGHNRNCSKIFCTFMKKYAYLYTYVFYVNPHNFYFYYGHVKKSTHMSSISICSIFMRIHKHPISDLICAFITTARYCKLR